MRGDAGGDGSVRLFQYSRGFVVAFGFDMVKRQPNPHIIAWSDPSNGSWEANAANQAGFSLLQYAVNPEFVMESDDKIIAYHPGRCVEMICVGLPYVWLIRTLTVDRSD